MAKVERIEQIVQPIAARHDCDIVQITFRREPAGWVLRTLIEKRGSDPRKGSGIDHALCAAVSRELGTALEEAEAIAETFVLEVSSPGIERPLTRLADYERFEGREVRIELSSPLGGRKRFNGMIAGVHGDEVSLTLSGGDTVSVSFEKISKAHLVFEKIEMHCRAGEK
jgi:ribosome maturation factor RimP